MLAVHGCDLQLGQLGQHGQTTEIKPNELTVTETGITQKMERIGTELY